MLEINTLKTVHFCHVFILMSKNIGLSANLREKKKLNLLFRAELECLLTICPPFRKFLWDFDKNLVVEKNIVC